MSPLTEAMIINGAVLIAVLEGDLGPHRKIGKLRILRPLITVAVIIPLFIDSPVTHGNGLLVELAGVAAGLLCGAVVAALMRVYRSPKTGQPVSAAGFPYALAWIVVVGARAAFSFGASRLVPGPARPVVPRPPGHRRGHHRRPDLHGADDGAGQDRLPGDQGPPAADRRRDAGRLSGRRSYPGELAWPGSVTGWDVEPRVRSR